MRAIMVASSNITPIPEVDAGLQSISDAKLELVPKFRVVKTALTESRGGIVLELEDSGRRCGRFI